MLYPNQVVRANVAGVLDKLGWKASNPTEQAYYLIAKGALSEEGQQGGLVALREPAVEPIIAVLKDPDQKICKAAAEALGKIGD